jgi:hypothetical protein
MVLARHFFIVSLLWVTWSSISFGELIAEKSIDDEWVVNIITENSVHATVNGQVTYGDGLHVRLVRGRCEKGNLLTFVYTYTDHPEIKKLQGNLVTTKFLDREINVKVLYTAKFLMGHRATIDMGWAGVSELKRLLSKQNPIDIKYLDTSEIKISDYFDITQNSWSNDGVSDALDRAVDMCKHL